MGIDSSKELRFMRVVVKNLVSPQQWESVMYGVCRGSESPRQSLADTLELVPSDSTYTSLFGSFLLLIGDRH